MHSNRRWSGPVIHRNIFMTKAVTGKTLVASCCGGLLSCVGSKRQAVVRIWADAMRLDVTWRAAGAAAFMALAGQAAQAQTTEVVLCNNTNETVQVAITTLQTGIGKWMLQAWFNQRPRGCATLGYYPSNTTFYYYGETHPGGTYWPAQGDVSYCVPNTLIERVTTKNPCTSNERRLSFDAVVIDGPTHTINFTR